MKITKNGFIISILGVYLSIISFYTFALDDGLKVNIIDTGAGLASVISLPNDNYIIYDAGHWNSIGSTMAEIKEIIPQKGAIIENLILSHTDSDHIAATSEILKFYDVKQVTRTGLERSSKTWERVDRDIKEYAKTGKLIDYNLSITPLQIGASKIYGDAMVTLLSGFHVPPSDWDIDDESEYRNATSIVMRVTYKGKSILFMGDAVGRHSKSNELDEIIATEKFLVDNSDSLIIDSDVLIASHHGANNGSSLPFIEAVSPEWVIFSAGSAHAHPREKTAKRFIDYGVPTSRILRTDLGDNESDYKYGDLEWKRGRTANKDKANDDHISIVIDENKALTVNYNN